MKTENLRVSYRLEVQVCHEFSVGLSKDLPPMMFNVTITKDPKGRVDAGGEGI
jgi:hypothetical protein